MNETNGVKPPKIVSAYLSRIGAIGGHAGKGSPARQRAARIAGFASGVARRKKAKLIVAGEIISPAAK